jgi:glyoxylase-like metal-dependent hydrolase (beta-lactamase superfamily II)/rhodanese-related sulfurtransferase
MDVRVISTTELGDRSYVIAAGESAVVVDAQRDIDRVLQVVDQLGATVLLVLETHIHNDYVTGGLALAQRTRADYGVASDDEVDFDRVGLHDGDVLEAGTLRVSVLATPGHTDHHLAFAVTDTADPDAAPAVFTGGSLLYGSVGRTDLIDPARTVELTRAQFHSARRLARELPTQTRVFPTHGFGSFCSAGSATGGDTSTIGAERERNDALTTADEKTFVDALIANLTAYPAYYAHMAPLNRRGPTEPDLTPPRAIDPAELADRLAAGEWVVDLRSRIAYAADHLAATVSVELGDQFSTYVGWLSPWDGPLTLIGESPEQIAEARLQLVRIGRDELTGAATGRPDELASVEVRRSYPRVDFATAARELGDDGVVVDVRRDDEYADGHISDAVHIPLDQLVTRVGELPPGRLWVHCASGFRASIAASLLDRAGRDIVHVDDDFEKAAAAGLSIEREPAAAIG